ncbi:DUF3857 domain-containing protein [Mucilaginibacter lacusdianchii]|uniref:DUF3857 domain-containing protein n=1 Tax=Mucilaginibacter lacusdianchii TaxID=2684211 RepID=UPI00131A70DE|nr:DUF3857 domain-containing protein [Mucilaginibacter sp. JXJ CY 39]
MIKILLALALSTSLTAGLAHAGDFPYGSFNLAEMDMKSYAADPSAHAAVLQEFGKSWISTSGDRIRLIHEYHVKIKIFDDKAFEQGKIEIPLHKSDNEYFESIQSLSGVTYYTDNGSVQRAELDPKQIFTENSSKYLDVKKFAMPNLRPGCVIEYKYTLESPYLNNFRKWEFQTDIPKASSEYEVRIPAAYNYKVTLQGFKKLDNTNAEVEKECFSIGGNKCDCSKISYVMNNVPAFVEEAHMTAPKNYLSAIYFELNDYVNLYNGAKVKVTQDWADIDRGLKSDEEFGSQMKRTGLFKEALPKILTGSTTDLDKAKAIYAYIQKNIKYNHYYGIYTDNGIRRALDTHSGSVADINLALVAALNAAGLNTEAVLLSTRDHGIINKLYPVKSDFNYVIAKVNIADKSYLLDATDPMLPFGLLPIHCINDQGRVMSLNKPSYWIDLKASQKEGNTFILDLTLQTNGKLKGTFTRYASGYQAYNNRKEIKKFNTVDEYIENLDERLTKVKILESKIQNLDSLDAPLAETYQVEIDLYDGADHNRLAFNPFILNRITENPFKLAERDYPIDWGAPSDTRYMLTLHMPEQYMVEAPPATAALSLPNKGGMFVSQFASQDNAYTFSHIIQINNSIYSPQEYPYLKELFNKIVQAEKADIIFKKKS